MGFKEKDKDFPARQKIVGGIKSQNAKINKEMDW